jgi:hypothetical protein
LSDWEHTYHADGCYELGLTATIFAPGSCQPIDTPVTDGEAGICSNEFEPYIGGTTVGTSQYPVPYAFIGHDSGESASVCDASGNTNVTVPRLGSFTNCTFVDYETSEPNYCGDGESS